MINDYDLWKHFSNDAEKVKEKLWTVSIWLFAFLGSILGFAMKFINAEDMVFAQKPLVATSCVVGLIMSFYAWLMITSYGKHVRTAWNRTNYLINKNNELKKVWMAGYLGQERNNKSKELEYPINRFPKFATQIRILVVLFGLTYLSLLFWCIAF